MNITDVFQAPLVFVDLETTGYTPDYAEIIEIAAIRVEQDRVVRKETSLIRPQFHRVGPRITEITGIRQSDVDTAPAFADVAAPVLDLFRGGAIFVAHNVRFDMSFMKAAYATLGVDFTPQQFCTVRLSRALYGKSRRHSLGAIIQDHNIPVAARHRAYDDAFAMWKFMVSAWADVGPQDFTAAAQRQLAPYME